MKRRTLILLVLLIATTGLAIYLINQKGEPSRTTLDDYAGNFAIPETQSIARVFLTHRDGRTIDLKRRGSNWIVNDQFPARESAVRVLMDAIRNVQIKYIPPRAAVDNIIRDLAVFGIKVEIFDRGGGVLKTYYVGGSTFDERGTHLIMEGAEQPFVAHIPSSEGSLRPRFDLKLLDWRSRYFLSYAPDDILKVTVAFPRQKEESFILERKKGTFEVSPYYQDIPVPTGSYKQGSGEAYLYAISNAACESYEPQYPKKDSIRNLFPVARYTIIAKPRDTLVMTLYPNGPVNPSPFSEPYPRLFADCSNGDFMVVQYRVLEKLFRGYSYFFH